MKNQSPERSAVATVRRLPDRRFTRHTPTERRGYSGSRTNKNLREFVKSADNNFSTP
jgi:hypothetical protein